MTNDELIVVLREEFAGFQDRVRDDVQEALGVFKVEMRKEINTAVQASEARMTLRMDQMQKIFWKLKEM